MKILMVLESEFPPDVRVENEMQALTEAGHQVHLACATRKDRSDNYLFGKAIVHRKPISNFVYKSSVGCLKFPFYFNFWRSFIFSLCADEKFEVIHIHDLPLCKIGIETKKKFGLRLVIDLHENWPALIKMAPHTQTLAGKFLSSNRKWITYEQMMLPEADKVITIIEEARDRIISLGVDPSKLLIVSNTINIDNLTIKSVKKAGDTLILFYGGAINRHRGLQLVIDAVKMCSIKKMKVIVWIVGDGSYRKELENISMKLGLASYIRFFGQKPFKEMLEILGDSDAAIIPHLRTENNDASSPNKLYQYMYLDKPIISSDCISLKRIINETGTGYIYKNDSAEDLFLLLEKLYTDRNLLEKTAGNGRRAILEKYNWNIDKKRLIEGYNQLEN